MIKFIRDRYVWYIAILLGIIVIFTFIVEQVLFGKTREESEWHPVFMTIRNFMFLGVVFLSAWRFGFKGGLAVGLAIGLIELPHVAEMFVGERRMDNLVEFAVFAPVGVLTSWLVGVRKKAEATLGLQAEMLDKELDSVYLHDFEGNIIYANKAAYLTHGYTRKELLNMKLIQMDDPESAKLFTPRMKQLFEKGQAIFEVNHLHKNGSLISLEIHASKVEVVGKQLVMSVTRDITERKKTEKEAFLNSERYRVMLKTAMDGIWRVDLQGRITEVNDTYCEMSGYSEQELLTMSISDLEAKESAKDTVARIQNIITVGQERFTTKHRRKDGSVLEVEISVKYQPEEDGSLVVFLRDVTEHNKLLEQLMAQDRLVSIGQLVSGVAHEINNPMTSVVGFSDLLLQRDLPPDIKADVEIINSEAKRTTKIVQNLLTFSRQRVEGKILTNIQESIDRVITLRSHEEKVNNIQTKTVASQVN